MRSLKSANQRTVNTRGTTDGVALRWVLDTAKPQAGTTERVLFLQVGSPSKTRRPAIAAGQRSAPCQRAHEIRLPGLDAPAQDR